MILHIEYFKEPTKERAKGWGNDKYKNSNEMENKTIEWNIKPDF